MAGMVDTGESGMSNGNIGFWLALLGRGGSDEQRIRLWNGYIGWRLPLDIGPWLESQAYESKPMISPPADGWPELTTGEKESIEALAVDHGGHPEFGSEYMDFGGHVFDGEVDFSDLVLINSRFEKAKFSRMADFRNARFHIFTRFDEAQFERQVFFDGAKFNGSASYTGTEFPCGCSFSGASFEAAWFNHAQFSERGIPSNISPERLVDFTNVKFMSQVDFRETVFGDADPEHSRATWPERVVDFSGATFVSRTSLGVGLTLSHHAARL